MNIPNLTDEDNTFDVDAILDNALYDAALEEALISTELELV